MYKDYNDDELLYLIKENSEEAHEILYKKYKPTIEVKAKKYAIYGKKMGLEYNDLFQEGMIGLSEAIKAYKDNKDSKFSSFANMCINRKLYSILSKSNNRKNSILNDSCSLDAPQDINGRPLLDLLFEDNEDLSKTLVNQESTKVLYDLINEELSEFEKSVFELKINGMDYKEISQLLNKSYKSIDGTLQRIKSKIKKIIDNKNL